MEAAKVQKGRGRTGPAPKQPSHTAVETMAAWTVSSVRGSGGKQMLRLVR